MKNFNENSDCSPESIEGGNLGGRPEYTCNLLVSAIAHVSSDNSGTNDESVKCDGGTNPVQSILNGAFGDFAHCDLIESFSDHGVRSTAANGWKPEKFQSMNVIAEVWAKVQITLPFDPSRTLSLSQQRFLHRNVAELLSDTIDADYGPEVSDLGVWLADPAGDPVIFVTGLFDVLEGRLSEQQLKRFNKKAWAAIPSELLGPDLTA